MDPDIIGGQKVALFDGLDRQNFGTLGLVVATAGGFFGLTCAHVGFGFPPDRAEPGSLTVRLAADQATDIAVPVKNGFSNPVARRSDAALVRILDPTRVLPMEVEGIGAVALGTAADVNGLTKGVDLQMVGGFSGPQQAKLFAPFVASQEVEYQNRAGATTRRTLRNLMQVQNSGFAQQGDSGAMVVADVGGVPTAVGMVVAVNPPDVFIVRIDQVRTAVGLV